MGDPRARRRSVFPCSRRGDDAGFTLIESVTALSILMIVMTSMITIAIHSANSITVSRQRQGAANVAARAMEQIRALPYATLTAGLVSADLAGDSNVVTVSGVRRLKLVASGIDEPLVVGGTTPSAPPLYPHVSTLVSEQVTYTVSTYVTRTTITSPYTLRVLVTWTSPSTGRPMSILQSSAAYSPNGCLSLETHPYSGPCQGYTTGQAGVLGGSVIVSSGDGPGAPLPGFDGSSVSVGLAGVSGSMAIEQVATTISRGTTTGAATTSASGTVSDGQVGAVASTSTDPNSGLPAGASATAGQPAPTVVALSGGAGTVTAIASSADAAAAWGHASSATTCTDALGGTLPTGQPCTGGSASVAGSDARVVVNLSGAASIRSVDAFDLARFSAAPTSSAVSVARVKTPASAGCPSASGDGCAYSAAARSLGTAVIGRLPGGNGDDSVPSGFTGMVRVTGLTERSRAEAGVGERATMFTRTGTLSYWNGSGYTPVDLSSGSLPSSLTPAAVSAVYHGGSGDVVISMTSTVTLGSTTSTSTGTLPCQTSQCTRTVKGSAVTVRVAYVVQAGGTQLTYFVVNANLGSLLTSATFSGAPSA